MRRRPLGDVTASADGGPVRSSRTAPGAVPFDACCASSPPASTTSPAPTGPACSRAMPARMPPPCTRTRTCWATSTSGRISPRAAAPSWWSVDAAGVCGYLLSTDDTLAFEAWAAAAWWPALRVRYPREAAAPSDAWLVDQVHAPRRADAADRRALPGAPPHRPHGACPRPGHGAGAHRATPVRAAHARGRRASTWGSTPRTRTRSASTRTWASGSSMPGPTSW